MEILKLIVVYCLSPLSICLILQCIGWLSFWACRKRTGLTLLGMGSLVLMLGGLSELTYEAHRDLEYTFEPLAVETLDPHADGLIVVLGTGFNGDPAMPPNSQISGVFLSRIIEGVRLYRKLPNMQLVISVAGESSDHEKMKFRLGMIDLLQLAPERVSIFTTAKSTAGEALEICSRFQEGKLLLVTSASHMKRAKMIFEDAGLHPTPAATAYEFVRAGDTREATRRLWVPTADGISSNHRWLYENAAMIWHALGGN